MTTATPPPSPSPPPAPPLDLGRHVTYFTWRTVDLIHRIHPHPFTAATFNPGPHGNARFSPINDSAGNSIPTIYGGTTFDCAAMETVFHDVPFAPGLKTVHRSKLVDHDYSQVLPAKDLTLVDLRTKALRKLGITRAQLIDTEKSDYPFTRSWAEAIHAQCPAAQGLLWVSRQDDAARAIVLFGDRVGTSPLTPTSSSVDILAHGPTYTDLLKLAGAIGVHLI